MARTYTYPATLEPDEDGRFVVQFPALPEALTDGADEAEALREAADCLSEALASRIVDGEEIPAPAPPVPGQYLVSPDPTIALKAALYETLRQRDMTVADLAEQLRMDWHQAARLIDPKRASKLTSLAAALGALGRRIAISVEEVDKPALNRFGVPTSPLGEDASLLARLRLAPIPATELDAVRTAIEAVGRSLVAERASDSEMSASLRQLRQHFSKVDVNKVDDALLMFWQLMGTK